MNSTIFWDVAPCSPLECHRRFGRTYCLHLQGRSLSQARTRRKPRQRHLPLIHGYLIGLLLDPEDEDSTFLRNVGGLLLDYTVLHSSHHCEEIILPSWFRLLLFNYNEDRVTSGDGTCISGMKRVFQFSLQPPFETSSLRYISGSYAPDPRRNVKWAVPGSHFS
jgi:hypothetical protein